MTDETMLGRERVAIKQQVNEYIATNFLYDGASAAQVDGDVSLLGQGVLDPTGVVELALFLEESYGITVDQADLGPENFDSVDSITNFVVVHLANM